MTTFTDIFGADTVPPSENRYAAYSLTASGILVWPFSYSGTNLLSAAILEVTANAGLTLTLPPANEVSVGEDILIRNIGANSIEILDAAAGSLTTINAGDAKFFYVSNNSSAAGTWGIFGYGAGSSTADASALASYGLKVLTGKLATDHPYIEKNGDYTVLTSDRARLINVTAGTVTISLPQASVATAGFHVLIRNTSIGAVTIDPFGTELVNGELTFELQPAESALFVCSGSSWFTVGYGRDVEFTFSEFVVNAAAGSVVLSSSDVAGRMIRVAGTATGNITVTLPAVDNVYFVNVESGMGGFNVTFTTGSGSVVVMLANQRTALYSDGTNVTAAITTALVSTIALDDGSAAVPTLFFVLDIDTGIFRKASGQMGFTSNGVEVGYTSSDGIHATGLFVENTGSGNSLVVEDSASPDSSPFIIDANGNVVSGHTAAIATSNTTNRIQSHSMDASAGFAGIRWSADANPTRLDIAKSRGATVATRAIVQNNDNLGVVSFQGDDGVNFILGAEIFGQVDGTPGLNDMPGRLVFRTTPDGSTATTERMRINSAGSVLLGTTTDRGGILQVAGSSASSATTQRVNAFAFDARVRLTRANAAETIVASGDAVGQLAFDGYDGAAYIETARIQAVVDGTPGLNDMPGRLTFSTTADGAAAVTERMRINSAGDLLVAATTSITGALGVTSRLQLNNATGVALAVNRFTADAGAASVQFLKSRNAVYGSHTIVQDGDAIANLRFAGSDGTQFVEVANIIASVDGTPGLNDMPGRLEFRTTADGGSSASERMRLDSSGRLLVGATVSVVGHSGVQSPVQIRDAGNIALSLNRFTADAGDASIQFLKSRNAVYGSHTVINSGDALGTFRFDGSDGTQFLAAAAIQAASDGTPGLNDMPGRLVFSTTADGAAAITERMRIDSSGNVLIAGTTSNGKLSIQGDNARPFVQQKSTAAVVAPGAGFGMLRWETGTGAGTLKLVAYSGTSTVGVTVVDNVGAGN